MNAEASAVLVARAQSGDAHALDALIARYLPRLRRWATGRLPARARGMTETQDLVQEALVGTIRNLPDFTHQTEGALQAYLRRAVMNRIRDEIRRAAVRPAVAELSASLEANAASPLELAMGRETFGRYERALSALDELEREAVIARVELGCSFQEIAVLTGRATSDAARMMVTRALARVAREMSVPAGGADAS